MSAKDCQNSAVCLVEEDSDNESITTDSADSQSGRTIIPFHAAALPGAGAGRGGGGVCMYAGGSVVGAFESVGF